MGSGDGARSVSWRSFVAFWLLAGITLLALGIAMYATVRHAHRVGGVIAFLGLPCVMFSLILHKASRQGD